MRSVTSDLNRHNPSNPGKGSVLGFPVHLVPNYGAWLSERIRNGQGTHVVTLNAEMTIQAEKTPKLAHIIRSAELVIPDGAGIVLYLQLNGRTVARCPGIELSEALLKQSAGDASPWSIFFFGGSPGVASEAAEKLSDRFSGLNIVGTQHGYIDESDMPSFLERLQALQPQLVYVGLGVPRQEYWIAQHRHILPHAVWIGVGGSFDIWAERKERAPRWLRENHLEWVYRLYQEPWRWRRMLALPQFAWRAFLEKLRQPL
ncbi:MAG TPA: WecB/TagA/CpsF family glycosyltransferase [Stenomitos sp.]